MVETMTTPDGKFHTLLGGTTLETIVREYAGDDAANAVRELVEHDIYEEARVHTDLGAYEARLEHWRREAQDWVDQLNSVLMLNMRYPRKYTRAALLLVLQKLSQDISEEL